MYLQHYLSLLPQHGENHWLPNQRIQPLLFVSPKLTACIVLSFYDTVCEKNEHTIRSELIYLKECFLISLMEVLQLKE